jgi:putative flippase GtrA
MIQKTHTLYQGVLKYEKVRFVLVGVANTAVDFVVFLTLAKLLGTSAIVANLISTTCALLVSYALNKKAVFGGGEDKGKLQFAQFIIVTLTGLWVLQSIVIYAVSSLLVSLFPSLPDTWVLLGAKVCATAVSLIWNYLWYSRLVFKKAKA